MSSSGLLCLKWNNHTSAFDNLLNNLHLKDVYSDGTIVCYGKFYPVHRFVLSTCSEYFDEIFRQSINLKSKHPFIIVKDIQPPQIEALLNYMYKGEVNVPQEMLPELIKAAEVFKIKGLAVPDDEFAPKKSSSSRERKRSSANLSCPSSLVKKSRRVEDSSTSKSDKISSKNDCEIKHCEELQPECSVSSSKSYTTSISQKETEELFISEILPNEVKLEPNDVLDPEYNETKETSDLCSPPEDDYISPRELGVKEEEKKSFDSYPTSEPFPPYEDEENLPTDDQYDLAQSSSWDNSQGFEEDSNLEENDSDQRMGHFAPWSFSSNNEVSCNAGGVTDFIDTSQPVISEKKFKCSSCPFQSCYKTSIARHFRTHTGEKPFQCSVCNFRCSQKEHLKAHLLIHSGVKPFQCDQCFFKCTQKSNLKTHLLIHSSEKPFSCPHCPYKAAQKQCLDSHIKKHI